MAVPVDFSVAGSATADIESAPLVTPKAGDGGTKAVATFANRKATFRKCILKISNLLKLAIRNPMVFRIVSQLWEKNFFCMSYCVGGRQRNFFR